MSLFILLEISGYLYPSFAVNITVTVVRLANGVYRRGLLPARLAYGKTRQGSGEAIQAVAEHRGDMPCLPAGATTRLTFVRPVLRPGPAAGTNETSDLPTRGAARLVPLRTRGLYTRDRPRIRAERE